VYGNLDSIANTHTNKDPNMTSSSSLYGSTSTQNSSSTNSTSLYGEAGTPIPDSSGNVIVRGTLTVNGCAILTNCSSFSFLPLNATTIDIGASATSISIGSGSGTTIINNQLATANYTFPVGDGTANQVLVTDGAGVLSFADVQSLDTNYTYTAGAVAGGVDLKLTGSDATLNTVKLNNAGHITATYVSNTAIDLGSDATNSNVANTIVSRDGSGGFGAGNITASLTGNATTATTAAKVANSLTAGTHLSGGPFDGSAAVTLTTDATDANTASTIVARDASGNFSAGGATLGVITVGVSNDNTITTASGDLALDSFTGNIFIDNATFTSGSGNAFIFNDAATTTVDAFESATSITMGATTGTTTVRNDVVITGDLAVNGGDITTTSTTANLFRTNALTVNIGTAGNGTSVGGGVINIGDASQTYETNFNSLISQNGLTTQSSGAFQNQTSTSPILITTTLRRSLKGFITINDDVTGAVHSVEFVANRKASTAETFITIYAEIFSDAPLATFTAVDAGATGLQIYATKASSNSTDIYFVRNSLGAVI